jgi:hypothetical protein
MGIDLLLKRTSDDESSPLVPIISREMFNHCWRPIAQRLGLAWVEQMETGFGLIPEDIPSIRQDLDELRRALETSPPPKVHPSDVAYALERVARLVGKLDALERSPVHSAYLG